MAIRVVSWIVITAVISNCGGTNTTKSEPTSSQPEDIAGGLGLTCSLIGDSADPSMVEFGCVFIDQSGQKFNEFSNIKLNVQVKLNDQPINFTKKEMESKYNFVFMVAKADVTSVQIEAKFRNPEDNDDLLSDKSSTLSQALLNGCNLAKFQLSFVTATSGNSEVELEWKANGDPTPIEGYRLRYWEGDDYENNPPKPPLGAQGNGVPLDHYNQGNVFSGTTATVTGLINGKTYTFGVTAYEPYRCGYGWEVYISATPKAP